MFNIILSLFFLFTLDVPTPPSYIREMIRKEIHPEVCDMDSVHSFDVLSYKINLTLDPVAKFIDGFTEVSCEVVYPSIDTITLDFEDMVIDSVLVDGIETVYDYGGGYLDVILPSSASAGETLIVHISYHGYPQVHSTPFWGEGIYFTNKVIYTLQCPEGSRYWYPSWDKPFDKATIEMVFTVPDTLFLCSNGLLIDSTNAGGMITYYWKHDYPAATYLQMFAASKYVQLVDTTHTVPIIHYVYPEDSADAVEDFAIIPEAIDFYSSIFGPYPFEKFGFSESGVGGGMEHQTNVSIGSFLITGTGLYELIFVHELAHQWWGDMVTLVDWRHCWLNEGFATYSEALWWEHLYGKQGLKVYVIDLQNQYLAWEAAGHLYPIFDPPLQYLFSTTTYEKAACVLHMLRFLIGDSLFFSTIRTYGETYKYINASTDDFKSIAEEVSGEELYWFFNEWIYGGGSPKFRYTVFYDTDSDSFSLLTTSESNTGTQYEMDCEVMFISGADTLVDTIMIKPYLKESLYILSGSLDNIVFDEFGWILTRGFVNTLPELSNAIPGDGKVDLFWHPFYDTTLYNYNVFYSTDSTGGWLKANTTPFDSTHYTVSGLQNNHIYYFKINATNSESYESDSSNILSAKPMGFPMDRGLLVVDETKDGSGGSPILPTDEQVDSFYDYCIAPISYTQWDCADKGLPPIDTLVHYKQVLWHDDDMGYSTINECGDELITYCYNGGGFVLSGWRTMKTFTSSMLDFYGITDEGEITIPKFKGVYGMNGYTDVAVDSSKMLASWNWMLNYGWHFDRSKGDTIALIESPDTLYDSLITGVRNLAGSYNYVILGFPLYFMEGEDAKTFLQKALIDIGTGVSKDEKGTIKRVSIGKPYPEPFSMRTHFSISLPHAMPVNISIFDVSGRMVRAIHSGRLDKGRHTFTWNGRDSQGKYVASSVYFIVIDAGKNRITRKVILLK
ncbi:T9SS type A sorting domain-containing protein [candidate division WOR-3 bacterium]|nr:T9SS type A sorting domain-containing protein [candidate division WOR-3 bacterium]